jgi:hypothetical protein
MQLLNCHSSQCVFSPPPSHLPLSYCGESHMPTWFSQTLLRFHRCACRRIMVKRDAILQKHVPNLSLPLPSARQKLYASVFGELVYSSWRQAILGIYHQQDSNLCCTRSHWLKNELEGLFFSASKNNGDWFNTLRSLFKLATPKKHAIYADLWMQQLLELLLALHNHREWITFSMLKGTFPAPMHAIYAS